MEHKRGATPAGPTPKALLPNPSSLMKNGRRRTKKASLPRLKPGLIALTGPPG